VAVDAPCHALHAEENAVLHLPAGARAGATVYVTDEPCSNCRRFLTGAGVTRVVWPDGQLILADGP
jgi:dCMP deaminase